MSVAEKLTNLLLIVLLIVLIGIASLPIVLVMVKLEVPNAALFSGHAGIFAIGLFISTLRGRINP